MSERVAIPCSVRLLACHSVVRGLRDGTSRDGKGGCDDVEEVEFASLMLDKASPSTLDSASVERGSVASWSHSAPDGAAQQYDMLKSRSGKRSHYVRSL